MLIRTNPAGDLLLENHRFVFATGVTFTRQKLSARFRFFRGEWFRDKRQGLPYFEQVFVKNPDLDVVRSLFRRVAATCPGVGAVPRFALTFDPSSRSCSFDFEARAKDGGAPIIVKPTDRDFLVNI